MGSVFILGQMGENTRVTIKMIKSMALVLIPGQMAENMLASGRMINDMAEGNIL